MIAYHELVLIPPRGDINFGLTAASQETMLQLFGRPGNLTRDCSRVTNLELLSALTTRSVGPFNVTGWRPAVDLLTKVFAEVKQHDPRLYAVLKTAGMLCCRAVRSSHSDFSNHSWGCAIDMKVETQIDELGADHCQRAILMLYPYMHKYGFFWAAGYKSRPDSMHFELATETVTRLHKALQP